MAKLNPKKYDHVLAHVPSLAVLAGQRREFTHAPQVWSDVLAPELARREIARKAAIRQATTRTIIGAGIPIFIAILLTISTLATVSFLFPWYLFVIFVSAALVSATAWIKVFTMKSQTKHLVLTAACEPTIR